MIDLGKQQEAHQILTTENASNSLLERCDLLPLTDLHENLAAALSCRVMTARKTRADTHSTCVYYNFNYTARAGALFVCCSGKVTFGLIEFSSKKHC